MSIVRSGRASSSRVQVMEVIGNWSAEFREVSRDKGRVNDFDREVNLTAIKSAIEMIEI